MSDPIIFNLQAELCHSLSQPARLQILHFLFEGPKNVGDIARLTGLGQSTVSRHLAILKQNGVVLSQRQGREILYSIANPKIIKVCNLMREVLSEQIAERSKRVSDSNGWSQTWK
jgi:ArsR family transcriptional regulator, virulence genes transcriptional regulator